MQMPRNGRDRSGSYEPPSDKSSSQESSDKKGRWESCKDCGSSLVQPLDWVQIDTERVRVKLRCPECSVERSTWLIGGEIKEFDVAFVCGVRQLARDLQLLGEANRELEISVFAEALKQGAIDPGDFTSA